MDSFVFTSRPGRVIFGSGRLAALADELDRLAARRALLLTTTSRPQPVAAVKAAAGPRIAGHFSGARMHVPVESVEQAWQAATELAADCYVAFGGGSAIGLAKALALRSGLPIVAIPTTYAGSEMTPIYGLTEGGLKRTGRDPAVLPGTVIYDPSLTLDLPVDVSTSSGVNAMAHAVEALYAADANPVVDLMAEEAIRALAQALPEVARSPADVPARSRALYGAWLAGSCLGAVGMGLHHKLCHTLGGAYDLPHALTHAILLPHTAQYNAASARQPLARAMRALGGGQARDIGQRLHALNQALGLPADLASLGFPPEGPAHAARLACAAPYDNPRAFDEAAIAALLERARAGHRPA